MNFLKLIAVLSIAVFMLPAYAAQKWVDENGYIHFGTKKPVKNTDKPIRKTVLKRVDKPRQLSRPAVVKKPATRTNRNIAKIAKNSKKPATKKRVKKKSPKKTGKRKVKKSGMSAKKVRTAKNNSSGKLKNNNKRARQADRKPVAAKKSPRGNSQRPSASPNNEKRQTDLCIVYTGLIERYSNKLETGCHGIACENYLELLSRYRRKKEASC